MINSISTILLFPVETIEECQHLLVLVLKLFIQRHIQKL